MIICQKDFVQAISIKCQIVSHFNYFITEKVLNLL